MKNRNIATVVIAAAITVVALTGCTAHTTNGARAAATNPAAASRTSGAVTEIIHQPGNDKDAVGAFKDAAVTMCDSAASGSTFKGTVTNPEKSAQSYRIYVSVIDGAKTLGVKEIDLAKVGANAKSHWSGTIDAGSSTARCVLRVERVTAG